jgi:flagellar protein FliL
MASAATVEPADAETEAQAGAAVAASSKRRRLIIIAAPLVLGLAGAGLWFSGLLPPRSGRARSKAAAGGKPVVFPMPEMVANLVAPAGIEHFVKVDISLVAANTAAAAAVRRNLPQLQDLFLTYLRDMHASELQSSIGTWRLREALVSRAAIILGPDQVTDVLFTNLLIQ